VKYWEIIADDLIKAGVGVVAASQRLIPTGEQSGLLTCIETMQLRQIGVRFGLGRLVM
jgi:hypothetical protein